MGQSWWGDPAGASFVLNQNNTFSVTLKVDYQAGWSDWYGEPASGAQAMLEGAASHVRELGLSFGGGWFFENGVEGTGSLTITDITVTPTP
jgi:hypothetical protein